MNSTKTFNVTKTDITVFLILLVVATLAPYTRNQYISGTIVNCTLLIATATLGIRAGLLICIIPSTIALATGLLPPVLAPMIPFIILGNAALEGAEQYQEVFEKPLAGEFFFEIEEFFRHRMMFLYVGIR